jgi:hypothetical protein
VKRKGRGTSRKNMKGRMGVYKMKEEVKIKDKNKERVKCKIQTENCDKQGKEARMKKMEKDKQ